MDNITENTPLIPLVNDETDPVHYLQNSGVAVFCNGTNPDGSEFYAYVLMGLENFEKYQAVVERKESYIIEEFGDIIVQGNTLNPPADVRLEMAMLYGFDNQFEKKLEDFFCSENENS